MTSQSIPIFEEYQIMHHAYLDIYGALRSLPVWFNNMQYDFYEKGLGEKDIGTGHEVVSEWVAEREVTDYYKYKMDVTFFARDVRKVVFDDGGEGYWARLIITINTTIVVDYNNKFKEGPWNKLLQQIYERYLIKEKTDEYIRKLAGESSDLINTLKSYLK